MGTSTAPDAPQQPEPAAPASRRQRGALLLAGVAVAYLTAQLLLVGTGRSTGFDEAIYLSEAAADVPSIAWAPHRALGLIWLLQPAMRIGASLDEVRLWLAVLSSVGLWLAFWPWVRTLGRTGVSAAMVFASCWVSLLYGTEVYPNLVTALGVVAAVGWAATPRATTSRPARLGAVAVAMAVVAVVRPGDSVWLALLLVGAMPWLRRDDRLLTLLAAGVGAAAGAVPWLVESVVRFDGPIQRLADIRGAVLAIGPGRRLVAYLAIALEGTSGGPQNTGVDAPVLLGLGAIVVLAALGALRPPRPGAAAAVRVAAVGGAVFAAAYVVLTDAVYVRFLLPAWGLTSLAVAAGLRALWSWRRVAAVGVPLAGLVAWWLVGQTITTRARVAELTERREATAQLAASVADRVTRPCYLFVEGDYPSLGYLTGCMAGWYRPDADPAFRHDPAGRAARGYAVYAVVEQPSGPVASWPSTPLPQSPGWHLLELPDAR